MCLALRLPTLIKAIRARACLLSKGYVDVSSLDAGKQQSVLGDLVWFFTYEPLRAALCGVSAKSAFPGSQSTSAKKRSSSCRGSSGCAGNRLQGRAGKARNLPLCLLNSPFENKQRFQLANVLSQRNHNSELVETLSDGDASRIKQFQAATKWAARHTTVHTPSCRGMGGGANFAAALN